MITIIYVLSGINFLLLCFLAFTIVNSTKKRTYAIIIGKNRVTLDVKKINPSMLRFKHKYEDEEYSYNIVEKPFIKHGNRQYILYEFNKPDAINVLENNTALMYADVYNTLLEMEKIKAINKGDDWLSGINKRYVLIGLVVIIAIILLIKQFGGG